MRPKEALLRAVQPQEEVRPNVTTVTTVQTCRMTDSWGWLRAVQRRRPGTFFATCIGEGCGLDVCDAVKMMKHLEFAGRLGLEDARTHNVLDAMPPGTAVHKASCPLAEDHETVHEVEISTNGPALLT